VFYNIIPICCTSVSNANVTVNVGISGSRIEVAPQLYLLLILRFTSDVPRNYLVEFCDVMDAMYITTILFHASYCKYRPIVASPYLRALATVASMKGRPGQKTPLQPRPTTFEMDPCSLQWIDPERIRFGSFKAVRCRSAWFLPRFRPVRDNMDHSLTGFGLEQSLIGV
jgi:hypothetical protein